MKKAGLAETAQKICSRTWRR